MNTAVLSCSLDPDSKSRKLAYLATSALVARNLEVKMIDMQQFPLPPFDNDRVFFDSNFESVYNAINAADNIVIASPVYNWDLSSVAKQVVEATGATGRGGRKSAWFDKVVGFLCAGGLPHSYTAYTALASTLMLDFKCIINPYTVYATEKDWNEHGELARVVSDRLHKAMMVQAELAHCLAERSYHSEWEV